MPTYNTPGVYIEEISTLAPSVAQVATAIPAFIGYTEKGPSISRISSFLEYTSLFGGAKPSKFSAELNADGKVELARTDAKDNPFLMYYGLSLYFRNGGGPCYIVSVGNYSSKLESKLFVDGLTLLEKEDEPTVIVLLDAVILTSTEYCSLLKTSLKQCHDLGDRFAIFDVPGTIAEFRDGIGTEYLSYGAAYHPYLQTSLTYQYLEEEVTISNGATEAPNEGNQATADPEEEEEAETMADIKSTDTALYNQLKTALASQWVTLPPSPAIAGIYAKVDGERGVWKAPANVSVASVIGPVCKISNAEQGELNVDASGGKSINVIRDFTGKGTLVWGARTLDGNSNEWRYVSVRRLFITIEESTRKATNFAVFEPNDATTWLKVKAMIDSYLYGLWEQGALAGSKPESAYFVNVGLGKTMTSQDILDGKMIVEIGVAAVRPAEFIILRFSHMLQEA